MGEAMKRSFLLLSFLIVLLGLSFFRLNVYGTTETRYDKNAANDQLNYVASYKIDTGSLSSGTVANLQTSDNGYMVFASASSGGQQVLDVEFFGSQSGHLPFIQIPYERKSSPGVSYSYVAAYNWTKGAYESAPTMYTYGAIGTSDATVYIYGILGCTDYVNSTGGWAIEVKAWTTGSPPPSFTVSIDMLYFRVVSYQFSASQSSSYVGNDVFVDGLTISIDVSVVRSDNTEEIIGSKVAAVTGPSSTTNLHNTWNCPATSNVVAVIIRIYRAADVMKTLAYASGGIPFVFISEDLNANLVAATWTAYYYFYYSSSQDITFLRFGSSTYNTRILNFQWSQATIENFCGTILLAFSISNVKTLAFKRYGEISETFTVTSTREFVTAQVLNLVGIVALLFALAKQKTVSFTRFGFLNPTFSIMSTANFVSAQILNLYGLINEAFNIAFQKAFTFNLYPTINPSFSVIGVINYFYGTMLNFFGSIVESFAVGFRKAFSFNIYKSILEHFTINHQNSWAFNIYQTITQTFNVNSVVNSWVGTMLNLSSIILFSLGMIVYSNLMIPTINLVALAVAALGVVLCLFPLSKDDDSAKALAAVTLVLSLAAVAFAVLGYSYALGVGAIGLMLAFASIAMVLATKKD
jgi:hypothetical protein